MATKINATDVNVMTFNADPFLASDEYGEEELQEMLDKAYITELSGDDAGHAREMLDYSADDDVRVYEAINQSGDVFYFSKIELKEAQRNENTAQVRMRLCKALKRARTSREMSQMVLSEKSGVARSNIARIEGGNLNTGLDTIIKLCEALDCSIEVIQK